MLLALVLLSCFLLSGERWPFPLGMWPGDA